MLKLVNKFSSNYFLASQEMSNQQIQRCIRDVLGIDHHETQDWTHGHLKKLMSATSTLYNASLTKVMLKQGEEAARCHLCAYIASERLAEKYKPDLLYYLDRVPIEPRKARKLMNLFEQNMFQSSPLKNLSWSPSPKKKKISPIKDGDRFTAKDPKELRKQLFGTPTKVPAKAFSPVETVSTEDSPLKSDRVKARRKLAFEEDLDGDDEAESHITTSNTASGSANSLTQLFEIASKQLNEDKDDDFTEPEERSEKEIHKKRGSNSGDSKRQQPIKRKKEGTKHQSPQKNRTETRLLEKKYYKVTPAEVIDLCNQFEIPREIAYSILDQYMNYASYLVCPWQLVCGLVLNATFVVFTERRRKDPRVDHLIIEKMCGIMKTNELEDIEECVNIVKELIEGEKWFRDLQVKNNYYDGACYNEAISAKLGSMLQPNNILVSNEQFSSWKRRVEQDLSMRDM